MLKDRYATFALSYRAWHFRVTPEAFAHKDPAFGLAALHALNAFSLAMLIPSSIMPTWLFVLLPLSCAVWFSWLIGRIYRFQSVPSTFARLSDAVPSLKEFPLVYAYLFGTLLLFIGCLYVAVRSAA